MSHQGWIGVDLDGTLAHYDKWRGSAHIGEPIPAMVSRVKFWMENGKDVRIFTARISGMAITLNGDTEEKVLKVIDDWCALHLGRVLPVTCHKDMAMIELWDDRCKQVLPNTGVAIEELLQIK